ncbi:Oidioi.mRNA.OKI2018_I69.chr1.g1141.t1.cds [Oikopleura dioica]|uniref:Oidioi.mRNA.OKI2018_I69.chr1.g1141.t1.cds n=1 Tax=Oikopleura dioica TaxID=34765 RepID=A0ABN7SNQ9_OIKDI|nr:Oidioi.mRNA.OKI2018_I69.chr1.g1141.t1.cds [Oikopleura dioica]
MLQEKLKLSEKTSVTPTEKLSVKLNFLRKPLPVNQINITEEMIKVLKSDLESKASAKLFSSGVSFRKLANVVSSGARMSHLNRILKSKDFGAEYAKKMLKRTKCLSKDVTLAAKVMIGKGFFEQVKNIDDPVFLGQAILALRKETFATALDSRSTPALTEVLFRGPLMTKLFEILVDSGGEMRKSLELIKIIPFDLARKLVKASKIFSNKLPETAVKRSTENVEFRENFFDFMTLIKEEYITPSLLSNLNFILSSLISGKTMARLLDVGLNISEATHDPRYLYAVNILLKNSISPEETIILMEAKETLNRLISADEKLIASIHQLLYDQSLTASEVSMFLKNSDERCRLREVLVDSTSQSTLAKLLQNGLSPSIIGKFMSETSLSISEKGNSPSDLIEIVNNPLPIFNLLDDKESFDFEDESGAEKPLLHPTFFSPLIYFKLEPEKSFFTTLENAFRIFVPLNSVSEKSYLTISCPRAGKINWQNDSIPLISPPLFINISKSNHFSSSRKITVLYPISRKSNTDFHRPQFFRIDANSNVKLDTTILTGRQTKPNSSDVGEGNKQLFCATDVEPGWTVVLALIPHINHSLFLTGKEKAALTKEVSLTVAPELTEDKPLELVSKLIPLPLESTLKHLKKNHHLDLKWISPIIQFTNARRIAFPISLEFKKSTTRASKINVLQKIPNGADWAQQEAKIQRSDERFIVQTKTISHLMIVVASMELEKTILEGVPSLVLGFSQTQNVGFEIFQKKNQNNILKLKYSTSDSSDSSDSWKTLGKTKTRIKNNSKFNLLAGKFTFSSAAALSQQVFASIYPSVEETFMIPKPMIEKLQIKLGSMQLKVGNEILNVDVSVAENEEEEAIVHPESLIIYFTEKISSLIPSFYASRLAEYLDISRAEAEFYLERNDHENRAAKMIVSSFLKTCKMDEAFEKLEIALVKLQLHQLAQMVHEDRLHANWTKMSTTSLF